MELTLNEKRLLSVLGTVGRSSPEDLASRLGTTAEAVIQHAHLLYERKLAVMDTAIEHRYHLTPEGREYAANGLPERQLLEGLTSPVELAALSRHPLASIAIGWMKRKGWVTIQKGIVTPTGHAPRGEDEEALLHPEEGGKGMPLLLKRGLATEETVTTYTIAITAEGRTYLRGGMDLSEEVGTLNRDLITSGKWQEVKLRRYRVETLPRRIFIGKSHPYHRLLDEMRQILLQMGFLEIYGDIVQSSYWNFDALFQPQDHPAREMQDTFYLDLFQPLPPGWERVRETHLSGGTTSSSGWGGAWSERKAEQCVLRTHTTCLSIRHLALHPDPPVKVFTIGRVYRREAIDPTHLPEFEQLEGIVMDKGVNFRHLLGFLKEFYERMGFSNVRFRPGYFPYTEPSVEPEVWVEGLGWVELGGAGIFREEVTEPFGVTHPVLAWGLGVSRLAMLKMGLRDLRQLYRSDVDWVREVPIYHSTPRGGG